MRVLPALLALALLAPPALAHMEQYSQSRALTAGPFTIFFEPRPTPPFANQTASMVAQVASIDTGALIARANATALVAGPGDFSMRKKMDPDGTGYHVASMVIPQRGNYSARIFIHDDSTGETHAADTEFEVFPDIPYRVRPVDPSGADLVVGQRGLLAFEVVDPITLAPKPLADLRVRMEHWTEDHNTFLGAVEMAAEQVGTGAWRITPTVADKGMYHLRFASDAGGFNYDDTPLVHTYATTAAATGQNESPSGGFVAALVALALVATLLRKR